MEAGLRLEQAVKTQAESDREQKLTERFLCPCGSTLTFEHSAKGVRVACLKRFESKHGYFTVPCTEPTQWCDTREEAEAVWRMIKVLSSP